MWRDIVRSGTSFRFVCSNGLVCGDTSANVRLRHKGQIIDNVIEGAFEVLDSFQPVREERDAMRAIALQDGEAEVFALAALALKYEPDGTKPAPIMARQILAQQRREDMRPDLWSTFKRTQ